MRWRGREGSKNIEDHRGRQGGRFGIPLPGGRGRSIRMPGRRGGGISIWTIVILLAFMYFTGKCDPNLILRELTKGQGIPQIERQQQPRFDVEPLPDTGGEFNQSQSNNNLNKTNSKIPQVKKDDLAQFTSVVLRETELVWQKIFKQIGKRYEEPKLRMFSQSTQSACGRGMSAMGPFYCPLDKKVYIDLIFYKELKQKFGAPGDFAQAYVIAHEVGHHVQTLLGIAHKVQSAKQRMSKTQANALQVRMELQADCFAGLWARHADAANQILEEGDLQEALRAASKIGDDNIQRQTQGHIVPEAFTHGTSAQRMKWFQRGYDTGNMKSCDTFNARSL
ncbi:MAG: flagellar biosynthesis protein FlgM [Methyloligella sp.]|nr:MAG: flagellar biosynthesis protein FlgM [Methyloligella sp.]